MGVLRLMTLKDGRSPGRRAISRSHTKV